MEDKRENVNAAGDDEGAKGDSANAVAALPEPRVVLFPRERIQLGWRKEELSSVGAGFVNTGLICYINSTLQVRYRKPVPLFSTFVYFLLTSRVSGVVPHTGIH